MVSSHLCVQVLSCTCLHIAVWPRHRMVFAFSILANKGEGLAENVPTSHIQRDLTDRQGAHTRCYCTQGTVLGRYYSREAQKPYPWPCDMAINEHQLAESSIDAAPCAGAHALSALL